MYGQVLLRGALSGIGARYRLGRVEDCMVTMIEKHLFRLYINPSVPIWKKPASTILSVFANFTISCELFVNPSYSVD